MSDSILVVEDNDDLLLLLKLVLESVGYSVTTANSGKDALKCLESIEPQLILMDIMMPKVSGIELSRDIKQMPNHASLPIMLVSAIDRLKEKQLTESRADAIIYKPFDIDDLVLRVRDLLSTSQNNELMMASYENSERYFKSS